MHHNISGRHIARRSVIHAYPYSTNKSTVKKHAISDILKSKAKMILTTHKLTWKDTQCDFVISDIGKILEP